MTEGHASFGIRQSDIDYICMCVCTKGKLNGVIEVEWNIQLNKA